MQKSSKRFKNLKDGCVSTQQQYHYSIPY